MSANASPPSEFLSAPELAKLLSVSASTLKKWRWLGKGPGFVHVGALVRYQRAAVDAWLTAGGSKRRRAAAAAPSARSRA